MSKYTYKATDAEGRVLKGVLEGEGKRDIAVKLQEQGYIPLNITEAKGGLRGSEVFLSRKILGLLKKTSAKEVIAFTQDLSLLLEAGLPVDRALAILIDVVENRNFKEVINQVLKTVRGGSYLSDALARHPKVFSPFYVNMVRAGEVSGALGPVLNRLGAFMETSQDLKDYIKSVMVYPAFLFGIGGISIIILLIYVVPRFSLIFSDMRQAIPLPTQILLVLSDLLRTYWWAMVAGLGAIGVLLWKYARTATGRFKLDRYKLSLPFVGELVKNIEVARFARTLGTLIRSGIPILQALILVKEVLSNQVMNRSFERIWERVKEGERLSKPLGEARIFPSLAVQMITVGEESGKLDAMLLRVAEGYEKATTKMIRRVFSLLEPLTILVMGLVVGFIVISMLMAIFSISEISF
jgi:general secretion pathway protein F